MTFYEINCEQCSREAENLLKIEKELLQYIRQLEGIEKELGKLSGFGTVLSALDKIREELYDEKDSVKQMGEILHASVQCYKNTEKKLSNLKIGSLPEKPKDGDGKNSAGEGIHFALDCMGLIPGIGIVFDGINACWYACEGRWGEVLLSGLALLPAVGLLAGAGKVGTKAGMKIISHTDDFADVAKGFGKLDDVSDTVKVLDKLEDASDIMKYGDDLIEGGSKTIDVNNPVLDNIRTGSALKEDSRHAFNNIIDNYAGDATKFSIVGGDGVERQLYQIGGSLNGKKGIFEWIIDPNTTKGVTHRRFIEGVGITGRPNARP